MDAQFIHISDDTVIRAEGNRLIHIQNSAHPETCVIGKELKTVYHS